MWKCRKCEKPVFFAERKQSLGYDWHPECLRCEECGKRLNPGQHAEHKGVPYCHVPCYGALFGPQLFGHGTRVESHKSYGQKGANGQKTTTNGGPALPRSHIESKVKFYNQFFDNKTNQIRSREVNGRFVLEGALKIYWGVQRVIHLKEDDDQRTVVTVRKRNSIRFRHSAADVMPRVSQRPHYNSYNSEQHRISAQPVLETHSPMTTSTNSNFDADNDTTISESISYDTLSMSSDMNSSPMGSAGSSKEPSPQHGKYPTLPPKLDVKQIEWDEIDELLQVERKQEDADRMYQTMPTPMSSQSTTASSTEVSDYKTCSVMTGSCSETLSPLTDNTPESPDKQLLSSATDTNGDEDVFATPTNTLKPEDYEDFKKQVRKDYINGANNMETYDEGTLKAMQPIDPRRINDSLKIYNDTVMNKSLTEEECFNVLALPKNCKITDSFNLKHFYDTADEDPDSPVHAKPQNRSSYRNYLLQKSESESSTPRRTTGSPATTPTTDDDPSSSSSPTLVDQPKLKKSQSGPNYYNSFMNSDDSDTDTLKPSNRASNPPRSVHIKMDCYDELEVPNNNNDSNVSNNNNSGNHVNKVSSSNSSRLVARNANGRSNNHNGNSVISEDKVQLLDNDEDGAENQHYVTEEGVMLRRRPKGSTAIKRRSGNRRSRTKLKRRCSINGHFYNPETSSFTPPFGSQMSVWVSSLVSTQDVINLLLEKYKVESRPEHFALFIMRDNGEQKKVKEEDYPLLTRVLLGPHEDVAKLFLMDAQVTTEISSEVAQFLNLSIPECNSILTRYEEEEEKELYRIREKYDELKRRIVQRMEALKVRL